MRIYKTTIWSEPTIIPTILKNTPTLDPLVIIKNSTVYIAKENNSIIGFVSIKKFHTTYELGTVFVYPDYRKKGYAEKLIAQAVQNLDHCYLLCHPNLVPFYEKCNFHIVHNAPKTIKQRQILFNIFLSPLFGYKICVMGLEK